MLQTMAASRVTLLLLLVATIGVASAAFPFASAPNCASKPALVFPGAYQNLTTVSPALLALARLDRDLELDRDLSVGRP